MLLLDACGRALRRTIGFLPELVPVQEKAEAVTIEAVATEKIDAEEYCPLEVCQPVTGLRAAARKKACTRPKRTFRF